MPLIVAVDPGSKNTGLAILGKNKSRRCITIVRSKEITGGNEAAVWMYSAILKKIKRYREIDVLLIEAFFGNKRPEINYLIGMLLLVPAKQTIIMSPKGWKSRMLPSKLTRDQRKRASLELAKELGWLPKTDHSADAALMIEDYLNATT